MKKHLFLLILISPLFLGACDFPGSNKIPEQAPPAIVIPEEENLIEEELAEEELSMEEETVSEAEVKALKYEVVLPSKERETERLLEEYEATLKNIEANLE